MTRPTPTAPAPPPTEHGSHDLLNIATEIVHRHVLSGSGDRAAIRSLARNDPPDADSGVLTYAELAALTDRFAHAVQRLGLRKGETLFLLGTRTPELYVALLGALEAGLLVCPLFSAFGPEPIRQRMELGDAAALVTTRALHRRKIAPIRDQLGVRHVILLDADDAAGTDSSEGVVAYSRIMNEAPSTRFEPSTGAEDPALLHFTSGTTGTPKGAVHVHGALEMHRATTRDVLGVRDGDVYWCTADPGWVTGTSYGVIGPLSAGATMVVDEAEYDAERWYGILDHHQVDVWYTAPTAIRMLMRSGTELPRRFDLSHLRSAFSVGEPLGTDAARWGAEHLGTPFRDTWWQTETGAIMIATTWDAPIREGAIGAAVDGIEATVLRTDDEGEVVVDDGGHVEEITDPETIGMIALRPGWPSMFRTYLNNEERYRRAFCDGWYLSGDLARRDADGDFWFVGRGDDVIKTAGHLIGPFEVEQVLNDHDDVTGSGVYGVPDPVAGAVVHARVVLREGVEPTEETLTGVMAHARRRLGPALAPREIVAVDSLPTTRSGKVMRRLLRARELGLPEGDLSTLEGGQS